MTKSVQEVADQLIPQAEKVAQSGKTYFEIISEIIAIGGMARLTNRLSMDKAEYLASAMLAAITLAKNSSSDSSLPEYPPRK